MAAVTPLSKAQYTRGGPATKFGGGPVFNLKAPQVDEWADYRRRDRTEKEQPAQEPGEPRRRIGPHVPGMRGPRNIEPVSAPSQGGGDHTQPHAPTPAPSDHTQPHAPIQSPNDDTQAHAPTPASNDDTQAHAPTPALKDDTQAHAPTPAPNDDTQSHAPTPSDPDATQAFNVERYMGNGGSEMRIMSDRATRRERAVMMASHFDLSEEKPRLITDFTAQSSGKPDTDLPHHDKKYR